MVLISRRYPFQDGHSCQNKVQGPRSLILDPWSMIFDPWSMIHDPWSMIFDLWSLIHDPWSMIHDGKPLLRGCHSGPVRPVRFRSVRSVRFQSVQSVRFRSVWSGSGRSGPVPVGPVPVGPLFYMSNCRVKNAALGNVWKRLKKVDPPPRGARWRCSAPAEIIFLTVGAKNIHSSSRELW